MEHGHEWCDPVHAARYRENLPAVRWWADSERAFAEQIPGDVHRVLDLGTGDGRMLALVLELCPLAEALGVDMSAPMLAAARARFDGSSTVQFIEHDLDEVLPAVGSFDLVISAFAIHHLPDERKRSLYAEVLALLEPGGCFLNLEHVASPTERIHRAFLAALGDRPEDQDPSDRLAPVCDQLRWLFDMGFEDVDCHWKWREIALLGGRRGHAAGSSGHGRRAPDIRNPM